MRSTQDPAEIRGLWCARCATRCNGEQTDAQSARGGRQQVIEIGPQRVLAGAKRFDRTLLNALKSGRNATPRPWDEQPPRRAVFYRVEPVSVLQETLRIRVASEFIFPSHGFERFARLKLGAKKDLSHALHFDQKKELLS